MCTTCDVLVYDSQAEDITRYIYTELGVIFWSE